MADPEAIGRSILNQVVKGVRSEAESRSDYNRMLNQGGWNTPSEPPRQQANRLTAENYARTHPGTAIGQVTPDGNNLEFRAPSADIFIGPDRATTIVAIEAGTVTAAPNHSLHVTTADGRSGTVNNPALADAMVAIGVAASSSPRGRGLPVMTPAESGTLASDAQAAINALPRVPAGQRQR